MKKKEFTLMELLVIGAIMALLTSIFLPNLKKARANAKIAVCISNQKKMAYAYLTYASENKQDAITHKWYNDIIGPTGTHPWGKSFPAKERPLNAYINPESKLGQCPSDKGDPFYEWNNSESDMFGSSYQVKYANPANIGASTNITNENGSIFSSGINILKFDRPDKKILFYNVNLTFSRNFSHPKAKWHDKSAPKYPVSFIDAHVEFHNFAWKETPNYYPTGDMDYMISNWGYY
jgi:type II secretory pathway pseudopilin PulG